MAISVDDALNSLRVNDSDNERRIVSRMLPAAQMLIEKHAPDAPEPVQEEASLRLIAYWFDMPNAHRGAGFANALRNSGAQAILAPYRAVKVRVTP